MEIFIPAQPEDASELAALVNSAYRGDSSRVGWTTEADFLDGQRTDPERILHDMNSSHCKILTLRDGGKILGCVYLEKQGDDCYLGMLTVAPQLQARGYGEKLLQAAEGQAHVWQCRAMVLGVIHLRDTLIKWYERKGYIKTGDTEPFPYDDPACGKPKRDDLYFVMFRKSLV